MNRDNRLSAVITAAGLSSRMGDFKPLMPIGGVSMARRAVEMMRHAGADVIVVVTGYRHADIEAELAAQDIRFVYNARYADTQMFDSLCLGLRALEGRGGRVLISPVDVPLVRHSTVQLLLEQPGDFIRPVCAGHHGHPVLIRAQLISPLLSYGGAGGLRGAVEALDIAVCDVETNDVGAALDADTPEDYRRLAAMEDMHA